MNSKELRRFGVFGAVAGRPVRIKLIFSRIILDIIPVCGYTIGCKGVRASCARKVNRFADDTCT